MADSTEYVETIDEEIDDVDVMTVDIDETLSVSGAAADSYTVGQRLIALSNNITDVDEKTGEDIALSSSDTTTIAAAVAAAVSSIADVDAKTGDDIDVSASDSTKISAAISSLSDSVDTLEAQTGDDIAVSATDSTKISTAIASAASAAASAASAASTVASDLATLDGEAVKSVQNIAPTNGNVDLSAVFAPLASPALTGTPTAPTAASGASTTQLATTAFVTAAVSDLEDSVDESINEAASGLHSEITNAVSSEATRADAAIAEKSVLVVTFTDISTLPMAMSHSSITQDMVAVNAVLSNPEAQTGDWTVSTSSGNVSLSGDINGTTSVTLYLMQSR